MALHFVKFLGHDGRQRIFLPVDGALLQGEVDFGEGDRRGIGADGLGEHQKQWRRRHAQLHALHVLGLHDHLVGGDMTLPVIGERDDPVLGLVVVTPGKIGKQLAVPIGLPVSEVAQDERRAGDAKRLVGGGGKIDAGVDHIDGAEAEPLVDLVLVAELRSREHLDFIFAVGPFLDFVGGPQRLGVIGFAGLVDMRPFQFGLGRSRACDCGCDEKCRR